MKLDTYLKSLTLLVDGTLAKQAPFDPEDLVIHLHDEASRWYNNAQVLRHQAHRMEQGSAARDITAHNAELFDQYADHCSSEIGRLLASMSPSEVLAMQQRLAARAAPEHLPFVKDEA